MAGAHVLKLPIHATPGAKRTEAAGAHGAALRVRLGAPPVDGKANAALMEWAARAFAVPKAQVQLLHGQTGRQKILAVHFDSASALASAQAQVSIWMTGAEKQDKKS
ncbi:DUF167 domain-containing protein [Ottowia sp.]|uniref:DUF167 domain-containing protein n=1 Tax=Ottowia sp. TaxID=1898956 RepID=UPI003A864207